MHSDKHYVFICDYAQNIELPFLGDQQPGDTYYLTPKSVYVFGMVDMAHKYNDIVQSVGEHLHTHVYSEKESDKGSNNVASLIMKTLTNLNVLRDGEAGGKLTIFFDNCVGQNKNNTLLLLVPNLIECGYFKTVEFVFLVVGHTKNACNRLFNSLKSIYRIKNIWHYPQLLEVLDHSHTVTIYPTTSTDFFDWCKHLIQYYTELKGKIKQHHIFHCNSNDVTTNAKGNKVIPYKIKEADIMDAVICDIKTVCKKKRGKELPNTAHPQPLAPITENPYKVVEFYNRWR